MAYSYASGQADSFGPLTELCSEGGDCTWNFTLLFQDAILQVGPLLLGCCLIIIELLYKLHQTPRPTATLVHHPLGWMKVILYTALLILGTYLSSRYYILHAHNSAQVSSFTPGVATLTIIAAILIGIDNLFHHV
ncbi:hypothetical protein AMS68_005042 [Peltaster fructicola]|uniref:Uncharacterized protein n=1 Tax=Peltaster fructicola TaxID=286661 RepID=A0A6H0XXY9_9PEZI|nr:hypothetical protein AMS68_005042 [Peltaster fructicola]